MDPAAFEYLRERWKYRAKLQDVTHATAAVWYDRPWPKLLMDLKKKKDFFPTLLVSIIAPRSTSSDHARIAGEYRDLGSSLSDVSITDSDLVPTLMKWAAKKARLGACYLTPSPKECMQKAQEQLKAEKDHVFDELKPAVPHIHPALRLAQRTDTTERDENKKQHHQRCFQVAMGMYLIEPVAVIPLATLLKKWRWACRQPLLAFACCLPSLATLCWLRKARQDTLVLANTLEEQRERTLAKLCLTSASEHETIVEQSRYEISFLLARMDLVKSALGEAFFEIGNQSHWLCD